MQVKELIRQLRNTPPSLVVKVSVDEEGNEFKDIDEVFYETNSSEIIIYPFG